MCKDMARLRGSTSSQNNFCREFMQQNYTLCCPLCFSGSNGVNGWVFLLPCCGRSLGALEWVAGMLFFPICFLGFLCSLNSGIQSLRLLCSERQSRLSNCHSIQASVPDNDNVLLASRLFLVYNW